MIEITPFLGYDINYDQKSKLFLLLKDGDEVAHAATQDELEEKAKKLAKSGFQRIPIFHVNTDGFIQYGELTSVNEEARSAYVNMKEAELKESSGFHWHGRNKIHLGYATKPDYHEKTEANIDILEVISKKNAELRSIKDEIKVHIDRLEKPINRTYFGIVEG